MPRRTGVVVVLLATAAVGLWLWSRSVSSDASSTPAGEHAGAPATSLGSVGPSPTARLAFDGGPVLDRDRADRIRAILRAAAMNAAADPTNNPRAAGYRAMPTGKSGDGGDELRDYIRSVIRDEYIPLAKQCYETSLAKHPKLAGRVELAFEVVGDEKVGGVVDTVELDDEKTTMIDPEFRTCIRESMLSVAFDAPPGGKVTVKYPLVFSDDDEPDAGR